MSWDRSGIATDGDRARVVKSFREALATMVSCLNAAENIGMRIVWDIDDEIYGNGAKGWFAKEVHGEVSTIENIENGTRTTVIIIK
jgi:hypothetical protein